MAAFTGVGDACPSERRHHKTRGAARTGPRVRFALAAHGYQCPTGESQAPCQEDLAAPAPPSLQKGLSFSKPQVFTCVGELGMFIVLALKDRWEKQMG